MEIFPVRFDSKAKQTFRALIRKHKIHTLFISHLSVSVLLPHLLLGLLDLRLSQVAADDGGLIDGVPALDRITADFH